MIIKCLLCNQVCAQIEQPDYFTRHKFDCKKHSYTLHYYTTDFEKYVCNFYLEESGYRYRVSYEIRDGKIYCCDVSYLTSDPPLNDGATFKVYRKTLCSFTYNPYRANYPSITPENIKQKLPTILVFS